MQDSQERVAQILRDSGLHHFGMTRLERPISFDFYLEWLKSEAHGDMDYLAAHAPLKEQPKTFRPWAESAIVVTQEYLPHPRPVQHLPQARIAAYAQGEDYHFWFQERLDKVAKKLQQCFQDQEFAAFTDSAPILERDLAVRTGLGWVGKNTCVIHPKRGSLFFIGEILTSLKLQTEAERVADHCGTCDRCLKSCPTQALTAPRHLDATQCISYWTIEAKGVVPEPLRSKFQDWFFGCDICQSVCPWNEKIHKTQLFPAKNLHQDEALIEELRWILTTSNKKLMSHYAGTPLVRARGRGLKRNALVVIGNQKLQKLKPEVQQYALKLGPLQELAQWSLASLNTLG